MAHPHFPNTQMVVKVNPILKTWWKDIQKNRQLEANEPLGGLTALISVESDRHLIKAERRWASNLLNTDYDIILEMRKQIVPNIGEQHNWSFFIILFIPHVLSLAL